jgi:uncharacterized LabA/DUF88 family protein
MTIMIRNYVFIDGNNLYLGAKSQNINLDYKKLRLYLTNKFNADKVFIFIGYDPNNTTLYSYLQKVGYILVHKPTIIYTENGKRQMKGNVDAELVLYSAAIEFKNYHKAIVITSDGDFACLIKFLLDNQKLEKVITPTKKYSNLLKPFGRFILPISTIKDRIK